MTGKYSIKWMELKKVLFSPVFFGLIAVFILFNGLIIFSNAYIRDDLAVITEAVEQTGTYLDEETRTELESYYDIRLIEVNERIQDEGLPAAPSIAAVAERTSMEEFGRLTDSDATSLSHALILESYVHGTRQIDEYYANLDIMGSAEGHITKYGLSGGAAEFSRGTFSKLAERLEQVVQTGEHKHLFFDGKQFGMHTFLFKNIFKYMLFEIMILAVLSMAFLTVYEFENKTQLTAYASRRGRRLAIDKLWSGFFAGLLATALILSVTLTYYFTVFDYDGLWQVPISSYFNAEDGFPYIAWWNLSFGEYVALAVVLTFICQLLFSLMAFILASRIRNSYIVFITFNVLGGMIYVLSGSIPLNTILLIIAGMTPFHLIMNPHVWFIGRSPFMFKNFELMTVLVWTGILLVLYLWSMHRFKKSAI